MISQNCPKCGSDRVRQGYRPTPIWSKLIFRYHLLCDNCNWEFTGFAVPGTVSAKPTRKNKKQFSAAFNSDESLTALDLLYKGETGTKSNNSFQGENAYHESSKLNETALPETSKNGNAATAESVEEISDNKYASNLLEKVSENSEFSSPVEETSEGAELSHIEDIKSTSSKKHRKVKKKIKIRL